MECVNDGGEYYGSQCKEYQQSYWIPLLSFETNKYLPLFVFDMKYKLEYINERGEYYDTQCKEYQQSYWIPSHSFETNKNLPLFVFDMNTKWNM